VQYLLPSDKEHKGVKMITVPIKKNLIAAAIGLALAASGAVFASQHFHSATPQAVRDDGGEVLSPAPALSSPADTNVTVNGVPVPLDSNGSATVNTGGGQANIHVSDNGQSISASTNSSNEQGTPNGQLNVSVSSHSSSGSSFSSTFLNQSGFSQNSTSSQSFSQSFGSVQH
jgi:hypothetical protein